jgi:hypothetical protein
MTAAPLSPFKHGTWDIAEDGFGLGRAIDNLGMYVYTNDARAAIAAAQSHFDRTIAERDKRITELEAAYRDATSCKPDRQMVKPDGSPLITPTRWQERAEAAERRAAEAEKVLRTIQQWDCLNPPDAALCADLPWIKHLVDDALRAEGSGNG